MNLRPVSADHAIESAAVIAPPASSLAALLTAHVLRGGEIVLLVLKPSLWFIFFQMLGFVAVVLLLYLGGRVFAERLPLLSRLMSIHLTSFLLAARLMWSTLIWMGRFYVLTDQRVIRVAGVFMVEILDCPLRKVEQTRLTYSIQERLCRVGTIEIHPKPEEDACPMNVWRTVASPARVNEQIMAAVRRARNGGG